MGIYIKDIKMPARCELCQFSGISGKACELISCTFTGKHRFFNDGQYMDGCPLVELPPHGRLIDADAIDYEDEVWKKKCIPSQVVYNAWVVAGEMPTIIEGEYGT